MKKRLFSTLLAVLMLISTVTVDTSAKETEWNTYYETDVLTVEESSDPEDDGISEENSDEISEESSDEIFEESSDETSEENSDEFSDESSAPEESSTPPSGGDESSGDDSSDDSEVETGIEAPVVKASNVESTGKVKLTWNAVSGAKNYKVYRSESKDTGYELMKTTEGETYTNTNSTLGKKYYYKVKAVAADGTSSEFSAVVSARVQMAAPVASVSNVESTGKIKISWKKVTGAAKYRVYRSTTKNGQYTLMKTVDGTSHVNESAKAGSKYYYKVKAVPEDSTLKEVFSKPVYRTCDLPKPVVTVSNDKKSGKIVLSWNKISGAAKYRVYRAETKNGEYTLMKTVTATTYTNESAKPDTRYYYKVRAVHKNTSANSAYSTIVNRLCDLAQPQIRAIANEKGKPKVTWEEVPGAVKYQIYRSNTKNGTYKMIYTVKGTSFVNSSAEVGKTYYYKVKAIASNSGANSVLSEIDDCACVKNSYKYVYSSYSTPIYNLSNPNYAVACRYINGTIVNPGEEFSFDDVVGPRNESRGFSLAPAIPEPNIGGGICQVSTTMFNTVLYANMKITDREQHSYPSAYVPAGRDAMISSKWSDFCFVNDSDYSIKISATATNGYVTIKFLTREKDVSPRDDVSLKVLKVGTREYVLVRRYKGVPNYYTYSKYKS